MSDASLLFDIINFSDEDEVTTLLSRAYDHIVELEHRVAEVEKERDFVRSHRPAQRRISELERTNTELEAEVARLGDLLDDMPFDLDDLLFEVGRGDDA